MAQVETGEPLVKDVVFTSEAFPEERQGLLPDAVIARNGLSASRIHSDLLGTIEVPPKAGRSENHHPDGIAILVEPNGRRGVAEPGDILDIKPMVFQQLGEHV